MTPTRIEINYDARGAVDEVWLRDVRGAWLVRNGEYPQVLIGGVGWWVRLQASVLALSTYTPPTLAAFRPVQRLGDCTLIHLECLDSRGGNANPHQAWSLTADVLTRGQRVDRTWALYVDASKATVEEE